MRTFAVGLVHFRNMAEPFDPFLELDESAKRGHAHDLAMYDIVHLRLGEKCLPDIRLQLLQSERKPPMLRIECQNNYLDGLAFFQNLGWVLYSFGPGQVRKVNQPVDALLNLHKCAEI